MIFVERIHNFHDGTRIEMIIKDHKIATDLASELLAISMYKDIMPLIDALGVAARHIEKVQNSSKGPY